MSALIIPLYEKQTIVWPPANRPISADMFDNVLSNVKVDAFFLAPSVLEELSQSQATMEKMARLKYVEYGGG